MYGFTKPTPYYYMPIHFVLQFVFFFADNSFPWAMYFLLLSNTHINNYYFCYYTFSPSQDL